MIRAQINHIWLTDSTNSAFLAGRCDWIRDSYPHNHLIQQLLSLKLYLQSDLVYFSLNGTRPSSCLSSLHDSSHCHVPNEARVKKPTGPLAAKHYGRLPLSAPVSSVLSGSHFRKPTHPKGAHLWFFTQLPLPHLNK